MWQCTKVWPWLLPLSVTPTATSFLLSLGSTPHWMLILVKAFAAAVAVNMDSSFDCNSLSLEGESLTIISAINSAASYSDWNFFIDHWRIYFSNSIAFAFGLLQRSCFLGRQQESFWTLLSEI